MNEGAAGIRESGETARQAAAGTEGRTGGGPEGACDVDRPAPLASAPNAYAEATLALAAGAKCSDESRYRFDGLLILRVR